MKKRSAKRKLHERPARASMRAVSGRMTARDLEEQQRNGRHQNMAQMKKSDPTEVAKAEAGGMPAIPDYMRGDAGKGVNVGAEDIEMPRIKLIQNASPEFTDGKAKPGHFYHTIVEQDLGPSVDLIPIFSFTSHILWRPRWDGGGILARAMDGRHWSPPTGEFEVRPHKEAKNRVKWRLAPTVEESGLHKWGSSNPEDPQSQPAATRMINVIAWLPVHPSSSPVVITLQRSSIKIGRRLMGKLKMSDAPAYGLVFKMNSVTDTGPSGEFFNFSFAAIGLNLDKNLYNQLKQMEDAYRRAGAVGIAGIEEMQVEGEIQPGENSEDEDTEKVRQRV